MICPPLHDCDCSQNSQDEEFELDNSARATLEDQMRRGLQSGIVRVLPDTVETVRRRSVLREMVIEENRNRADIRSALIEIERLKEATRIRRVREKENAARSSKPRDPPGA